MKSKSSIATQRPPHRFDAPPRRRCTAISIGTWCCRLAMVASAKCCRSAENFVSPDSSKSTDRPSRASSNASTMPTGPAPTTHTSCCVRPRLSRRELIMAAYLCQHRPCPGRQFGDHAPHREREADPSLNQANGGQHRRAGQSECRDQCGAQQETDEELLQIDALQYPAVTRHRQHHIL